MDFNTLLFPCFFAVCAVLYYLLPSPVRPWLLLAASYAFYCYAPNNRALVALLVGATVITWACGLAMGRLRSRWARRAFLALSCVCCLGILFYFKYYNFFAQILAAVTAGSVSLALRSVIAPLGLSYFTFQSLGYAIDCYRGKYPPEKNPLKYALFVSFFPCIFTGPIERADHLLPQLFGPQRPRFDYDTAAGGAFRMLWGYCKKMVLADHLAVFVRAYYAGTVAASGPAQALAAVLFSLQLYFDFSGCCDIAIGGARLFGIRLLENFDNPFLSVSYGELWRRWHKSLNNWFRDYLYIPLGGSRCPPGRWALNFLLVFVLSGLWHGAAAGYFWWGLLCGVLVLAERLPQKLRQAAARAPAGRHAAPAAASPSQPARPAKKEPAPLRRRAGAFAVRWLRRGLVFCEFSFCFILFAAALYGADVSLQPLFTLFTGWTAANFRLLGASLAALDLTGTLPWMLAGGSVLVFAVESRGDVAAWIRRQVFPLRWLLYFALGTALLFFGVYGQSNFIYQLY